MKRKKNQARGTDWTAYTVDQVIDDILKRNLVDGMEFIVLTRNQIRALVKLRLTTERKA